MRGPCRYAHGADRLHYASAAYTIGPVCVLAAVLVRQGLSSSGLESVAAVAVTFLAGPVIAGVWAYSL